MSHRDNIVRQMVDIAYQPFLIFATQLEEKTDNALETLRLLAKEEHVTAGRISEYLDVRPSSVTQIINKLEVAGMAERVKSENDARVVYVRLTDKGREATGEQGTIISSLNEALFAQFTDQELEEFDTFLSRVETNITSETFQRRLNEIFGDDARWNRLAQMSARFGRAREHMMMRGGFGGASRGHGPHGHGDPRGAFGFGEHGDFPFGRGHRA